MKRRDFIKVLGIASLLAFAGIRLKPKRGKKGLIRPPGAVEEDDFNYKCVRCGKCILACPAKCLKPAGPGESILQWGTPHITPRTAGCIMCLYCADVCPALAIVKVNNSVIKIGTADINNSHCLVWLHQKDCLVCMEYCPVGAIHLDHESRPVVDENLCIGCGLCEENCPVEGESAIKISNKGEKRYRLSERRYR